MVLFAVAAINGYFVESLIGASGAIGGIICMIAVAIDKNNRIISKISKWKRLQGAFVFAIITHSLIEKEIVKLWKSL